MTCRRFSQCSKTVFICFLYLLLTFFPVVFLAVSGRIDDTVILNMRRAGLMVNSLVIAFFTVMICLIVAIFASLKIYCNFGKKPVFRWFFLFLSPVPPYIYALSYMNLFRFLGRLFPGILRYRMSGLFPCIMVESFVYLPFACAAALIALEQVNTKEWSAALLFENADSVFFRVILPKQLPWLLAAGAIIFVLSITDYAIPSLFQVNVYAMEIFSDYSAAGQSVHSLYLAFPLLVISTIVTVSALFPLKNVPDTMKADGHVVPDYSPALRIASGVAFVLTLLQIILPLISFVPYLAISGAGSVSVFSELWNSCLTGAVAVLLMMIPSALMALGLTKNSTLCKPIMWIIAILPLSVPGVLTGIGVLDLFSSTPLFVLRTGVILPAIGLSIRYMPFAMLIQYGCYLRIDRERIRAAVLLQPGFGVAFTRVQLPLMAPGLLISGIVVFLLTLGDVGTSLVLMSAGREPMSVKIYNYLHYGASEKVTVFCLIQMAVSLLLMGAVYYIAWLFERKRYVTEKMAV